MTGIEPGNFDFVIVIYFLVIPVFLFFFVWTVVWTAFFVWNLVEVCFYGCVQFFVLVSHAVLVYILQHIRCCVSHSGHSVFVRHTESEQR